VTFVAANTPPVIVAMDDLSGPVQVYPSPNPDETTLLADFHGRYAASVPSLPAYDPSSGAALGYLLVPSIRVVETPGNVTPITDTSPGLIFSFYAGAVNGHQTFPPHPWSPWSALPEVLPSQPMSNLFSLGLRGDLDPEPYETNGPYRVVEDSFHWTNIVRFIQPYRIANPSSIFFDSPPTYLHVRAPEWENLLIAQAQEEWLMPAGAQPLVETFFEGRGTYDTLLGVMPTFETIEANLVCFPYLSAGVGSLAVGSGAGGVVRSRHRTVRS
jgi:hypothetical protein